jgi:hypothetical protein
MALEGMTRVLEIHAGWLKDWRASVEQMESGKIRHLTKGLGDRAWVDCTQEMIDDFKKRIAMIEEIDKHYRP